MESVSNNERPFLDEEIKGLRPEEVRMVKGYFGLMKNAYSENNINKLNSKEVKDLEDKYAKYLLLNMRAVNIQEYLQQNNIASYFELVKELIAARQKLELFNNVQKYHVVGPHIVLNLPNDKEIVEKLNSVGVEEIELTPESKAVEIIIE